MLVRWVVLAHRGGVSLGSKKFFWVREKSGIWVTNEKVRKSRRVMSIRRESRKVPWGMWMGIMPVVVWAYRRGCCNEGVLCVWRCNCIVCVCMWK